VAVDQAARQLYLFGGQSADQFFNDAWRFDLAEKIWTEIAPVGAPPAPRYGTSAVLDDDGRLLISHGFTFDGRFDDTWALDVRSGQWADLTPPASEFRPLKRCLHEAVWDTSAGRMLLFGGCSSGFGPCPQGDLWSFDPGSRTWSDLTGAPGPAARSNPSFVYDRARKQTLLFAGLTDGGYSADLWIGHHADNGFTWSELTLEGDGPAPRASHDAVMAAGALYIFGGASNDATYNDLWRLKLAD
jgi:hypothetical protein